jgi:hypothetical protein
MNPRDTILTPLATRPIGPDVAIAPSNPILAGLKTADMFYDRPIALRNLDRQVPNLSTAPKIRTMENPFTTPDMTLRQVPPNLMASMPPRWEVTQNDASNYAVPKRNQFGDESILTRRMLQDQQLIYGDRVPPQVLMDPKRQAGLVGDMGEAYLRVPKRNSMDISFGESRNTQNARFYGAYTSNVPTDINDVSRRRMPDRGQFVSQSTPREFADLDSRSQTIFTRNMANATDANLFLKGFSGGKVPGSASRFEVPVDSRRRI